MPRLDSSAAETAAEALAMLSQTSHNSVVIPEDDADPTANSNSNKNEGGEQQPPINVTVAASAAAAAEDLVVLEALSPKPLILTTKPKVKTLKDKITVPASVKVSSKTRSYIDKANNYINEAVKVAKATDLYAKSLLKESQGHIDSLHTKLNKSIRGSLKKVMTDNATLKLNMADANLKLEAANKVKKAAEDENNKLVKKLETATNEAKKAKDSLLKEAMAKKPKAKKVVPEKSQIALLEEKARICIMEYDAKAKEAIKFEEEEGR
jgi:hypothetical protein